MITAKAKQKVLTFLQENPASTKEAVGKATKVKGLDLTNLIKGLRKEGVLVEELDGEEMKLSIKPAPVEEAAAESAASSTETEIPVEDEQTAAKSKGRDNSTFKYSGADFKKGPLVRQILTDHVTANKGITYKKLKEAFPDELLKRFGVFQDEDTARSLSGARDRYAFQPENLIKLKDKTIAVCNQWTLDNIQPFLKVARALGYKIK